jgi:predicted RNA-binding Zn-ribbon protein involved in translation (DUF1610 family)
MILVSELVDRYRSELERMHGHELLPSHQYALSCMRSCRNQYSAVMLLECSSCQQRIQLPHSCGHRSCPHCQHHESQRWLQHQRAKLLPVEYYLVTFTVPEQLRQLFWQHQRTAYDLLLKTAWQTLSSFVSRDPRLKGRIGAHAVLHTHSRRLDYHPHVHLIIPAGAVNEKSKQWRKKSGKYLFRSGNFAKVFRSKWFDAMGKAGLSTQNSLPAQWVVDCKHVGSGDKALVYLGRYLYRGVLPEKNILAEEDGNITFRYTENSGEKKTRTLSGAEFLWHLLLHVLPKRFRRVRDFGFLHGNCKKLIQLLQLLLGVRLPEKEAEIVRPPVHCPLCGNEMTIIATRLRLHEPLLC